MTIKYTDYLLHYGIPGMKWGKRKAQNRSIRESSEGGTIHRNQKGKIKRFELSKDEFSNSRKPSADAIAAKKVAAKKKSGSLDSLTNDELKTFIDRKNLESQYSSLMTKEKEKTLLGGGQKIVKDISRDLAKETAKNALRNGLTSAFVAGQNAAKKRKERKESKESEE